MPVESSALWASSSGILKLPSPSVYEGMVSQKNILSPLWHLHPLVDTHGGRPPYSNHCPFTNLKEEGDISALAISPNYTGHQDWHGASSTQVHHKPWQVFHYTKVLILLLHQFHETLSSTGVLVKWIEALQGIPNWQKNISKLTARLTSFLNREWK